MCQSRKYEKALNVCIGGSFPRLRRIKCYMFFVDYADGIDDRKIEQFKGQVCCDIQWLVSSFRGEMRKDKRVESPPMININVAKWLQGRSNLVDCKAQVERGHTAASADGCNSKLVSALEIEYAWQEQEDWLEEGGEQSHREIALKEAVELVNRQLVDPNSVLLEKSDWTLRALFHEQVVVGLMYDSMARGDYMRLSHSFFRWKDCSGSLDSKPPLNLIDIPKSLCALRGKLFLQLKHASVHQINNWQVQGKRPQRCGGCSRRVSRGFLNMATLIIGRVGSQRKHMSLHNRSLPCSILSLSLPFF